MAAGLAGLWVLTLAGRLDRTPAAWLVLAVLVLPWLHALSWAALLASVAGWRRQRGLWVLCGLHFALAQGVGGGACASAWLPTPTRALAPAADLRVLTWNVGRMGVWATEDEGRCTLSATIEGVRGTLAQERPDVAVLLEVTGARRDALARDAALTCVGTDYRGQGGYGAGGLGICVPAAGTWAIARSRDLRLPPGWRYVFAELTDGVRAVNVLALHVLPYGVTPAEAERAVRRALHGERGPLADLLRRMERAVAAQAEQVAEVRALVAGFRDPTVVAGDFNSAPDSAVHAALRRQLDDAWLAAGHGRGSTRTVAGHLPLRIDYVYVTPGLTAREARTVGCRCARDLACSDHEALVADLALTP